MIVALSPRSKTAVRNAPLSTLFLTRIGSRAPARFLLFVSLVVAPLACRSAYGIDPVMDPEAASKTPGRWRADLQLGGYDDGEFERYDIRFDGTDAWIRAAVRQRTRGYRQWVKPLTRQAFEQFAASALQLEPYGWQDHSARGSFAMDKLRLEFQAGDRGRSVYIEGPNNTELLLVDRMRALAGEPPAVAAGASGAADGKRQP